MKNSNHHANLFRRASGLTYNLSAGKTVSTKWTGSAGETFLSMVELGGITINGSTGLGVTTNLSTVREISWDINNIINLNGDLIALPSPSKFIISNGTLSFVVYCTNGRFYTFGVTSHISPGSNPPQYYTAGSVSSYYINSIANIKCICSSNAGALVFIDASNNIRTRVDNNTTSTIRAANADLSNPQGMDYDASGNLYICDQGSDTIKKLTSGGVLSVFCGSGTSGYRDGSASEAKFLNPKCIRYMSAANCFYVSDENNVIRKIDMSGNCYTLAGVAGTGGYQDGVGSSALFLNITDIYDRGSASGTAYILEGNDKIRSLV